MSKDPEDYHLDHIKFKKMLVRLYIACRPVNLRISAQL